MQTLIEPAPTRKPASFSGGTSFDAMTALVQTGTVTRTDFIPTPLDPTWILGGTPNSRSLPLGKTADDAFSFGLWDCTPGEFKFIYACDELVHILEGNVTVRTPDGERQFGPGDVVFFPQGLTAYWTVHAYIKKLAIFRSAPPSLPRRIAGALKRTWGKLRAK